MKQDQPVWLMSLRTQPNVSVIGKAVHGVQQLTETWRLLLWGIALLDYHGEYVVDDRVLEVRPGMLGVFPPGLVVSARFNGRSELLYCHFGLTEGRGDEVPVAFLTELGSDVSRVRADLERGLSAFSVEPELTSRVVYDLLREVSGRQPPGPVANGLHPSVRAAVGYIESNLHLPMDVKAIASRADLSERQLSTQFGRQLGTTVVGYLRRRRAERARQLLATTDLSAKIVAGQIGIHDLQQFNKLIRRECGVSPRALRTAAQRERFGG